MPSNSEEEKPCVVWRVPTMDGDDVPTEDRDQPVKAVFERGLRVVLGEDVGVFDRNAPSLLIERHEEKWTVIVHPDDGDPAFLFSIPDRHAKPLRWFIQITVESEDVEVKDLNVAPCGATSKNGLTQPSTPAAHTDPATGSPPPQ